MQHKEHKYHSIVYTVHFKKKRKPERDRERERKQKESEKRRQKTIESRF